MKKIPIKLNFDRMSFFIEFLNKTANATTDKLVSAVLLECYVKHSNKTAFRYKGERTINLSMSQALAFKAAIGKCKLDEFTPYALSVVTPIYQTIDQQTL